MGSRLFSSRIRTFRFLNRVLELFQALLMFPARHEENRRVLGNPAALHKNPHRARMGNPFVYGENADGACNQDPGLPQSPSGHPTERWRTYPTPSDPPTQYEDDSLLTLFQFVIVKIDQKTCRIRTENEKGSEGSDGVIPP
jgi:hypothetical protein